MVFCQYSTEKKLLSAKTFCFSNFSLIFDQNILLQPNLQNILFWPNFLFSDIFEPLFLFLQKLEKPFGRTLLFCHCQVISSETGCLRNRTRILVTHGVGFLDKVDRIFVMKDGAIVEVGSHGELMAKKGAFSEFLTTYQSERQKKYGEDKEVAQERKKTVSMSSGKGIPMQRQLPSDSRLPTGTSPRSWAHFQPSVCDDEEDVLSLKCQVTCEK